MKQPKQPIDRGAPASVIAAKFGGMAAYAREIGRTPSTVHRWLVNGAIPHNAIPDTNEAAARLGIKIAAAEYVDMRTAEQKAADAQPSEAA